MEDDAPDGTKRDERHARLDSDVGWDEIETSTMLVSTNDKGDDTR
jgi:hypothetical protein